jgi:ribonuclease VapC
LPGVVLDASALLAHLRDETGAVVVADAIGRGASMSAVNLAEVLSPVSDRGADPDLLADRLAEAGLLHGAVVVEPFTAEDAVACARLRSPTREAGLSLGDRACLALAQRLNAPTLTADTAWSELDIGVEVLLLR